VAYLARGQRLLHQVQRGALATEPYVIHIAPLPPYVAYLARGQRLLHQVQRGALATEPYVIHIEFEMSALEDREEEEARDSSMEATQRPSVWGAVSRRRLIGWISKGRLASSLGKNPGAAAAAAGAGAGAQETLITVAVPAAVILSRSYLVAVDGNGAFLWRCRLARIEAIRERSDPTGIRWLWIQARPRRGRSRRAYHDLGSITDTSTEPVARRVYAACFVDETTTGLDGGGLSAA
jgi:hypothetical protein